MEEEECAENLVGKLQETRLLEDVVVDRIILKVILYKYDSKV
jgi:hypothetical protein